MTKTCDRIECGGTARWRPVMLLRAKCYGRTGGVARCVMGISLCDVHRFETDPAMYVTDEAWAMVVEGFRRVGKVEPDRATAEIDMISLDAPEARLEGMR